MYIKFSRTAFKTPLNEAFIKFFLQNEVGKGGKQDTCLQKNPGLYVFTLSNNETHWIINLSL